MGGLKETSSRLTPLKWQMGLDAAQQAQREEEEKQNEEALKAILLAQGTSIEVILLCVNVQPHAADKNVCALMYSRTLQI